MRCLLRHLSGVFALVVVLAACDEAQAAFERRCIPPEPRRCAALCVAFQSEYTGYSSLTRLVSRAPHRSRRSPEFHHRLLAACDEAQAAFGRRCIPPEPRRCAALCVAFQSEYTGYSSLTRLVSRAPHRSRRSPEFHHRLPSVIGGGPALGQVVAPGPPPVIRLYGLITHPGGGVALLQFDASRPLALRMGESHRGFAVRQILADRVQLETPEGERLDIGFPETAALPSAPERSAIRESPPEPPSPRDDLTLREGPPESASGTANPLPSAMERGERRFSRDDVRLRLQSELPRILASTVVAPRVLGNEVVGLELVAFPTDTVLGDTGLTPGDVLLAVNGREVRGAESLAVLVQRFQTASEIEITVDRDGEVFPLRYRIE